MSLIFNFQYSFVKNRDRNAFFINGIFYNYFDFTQSVSKIRKAIETNIDEQDKNIGLVANDDIETYAGIIALWLEGKAYVPLNPESPTNRNEKIINEALITTIIDSSTNSSFSNYHLILSNQLPDASIYLKPKDVSQENIAYLMFTSGTTGQPKGVPISWKNLNGFVNAFEKLKLTINETDKFLQMFELTFDLSVMSYLIPLIHGSCIYTVPKDKIKFVYVYQLMVEQKLTVALMVPSILNFLRPHFNKINVTDLRYSLFCGEALHLDVIEEWSNCVPTAEIINFYGPTEATIFCTYYKFKRSKKNESLNGVLSIGRSMNDTTLVIVDENNQILPSDSIGQLCIGGIQLTEGYWKNIEKNKEAFFLSNTNGIAVKFYKTGDLCRDDKNGNILFLGRVDFQTKVQGFRVELFEIDFHVRNFLVHVNAISLAVNDNLGNTEIALVIQLEEFNTDSLTYYLRSKMPEYMIPKQIFFVSIFPLNSNGKVDRNELIKLIKKTP